MSRTTRMCAAVAGLALAAAACGSGSSTSAETITVYSGRSEKLIGDLIAQFEKATGIAVAVRYGDTAELASTILEEGPQTPADIFFAQDAGALGALEANRLLAALGPGILDRVPATFRSTTGAWVGASGRVRVLAYNPSLVAKADLPPSVLDLTDPKWKGKVAWAPTNGSFQSFVTALRKTRGQAEAKAWLEAMKKNGAREYPKNDAIVAAIASGEIPTGLVNHYYPFQLLAETPDADVADHFFKDGDPGALVNVAGVGILSASDAKGPAATFIEYLLSTAGQEYFVTRTFEYPLVPGVKAHEGLPAFESVASEAPDIDLADLADLEGSLALLREVGLL